MNNKLISKNLELFKNHLPIKTLKKNSGDSISITVSHTQVVQSLFILKNHVNFQFKMLSCISGVDYPQNKKRFQIVYELLSLRYNSRITLIALCDELEPVDSATHVFKAASWYESEIWDMFGVFFKDHPNLTRLLTDYGFEGFPLRKDFPLSGFIESSYDYTRKQVLNNKISLSQESKAFKFESPWNV